MMVFLSAGAAMEPNPGGAEENVPLATRAPPGVDPGTNYAIITTSALEGSFLPLARWRSQMGLKAEVFLLDGDEGILSGPGGDDAEKLHFFINDIYSRTEGGLQYVLLGGDSDVVPIRYLHANASYIGLDEQYLSDVYFSSPEMEWDGDGDGRYGEIDDLLIHGVSNISFPLRVGRVPINNTDDADLFCQRVIDYETDPPDGDWYSRGILASSVMDRPNIDDDPVTPTDEGYNAYKDNGYKAIESAMRYIPYSMDITHLHDYQVDRPYWGGNYSEENDTLTMASLPENISNGCSFVSFAGQSFYDSSSSPFSLANWVQPTGTQYPPSAGFGPALAREDIDDLSNGGMLPVMYLSSCDSFNFSGDNDQDLEALIYAQGGGAISVIGSTGVSWRGEGADFSLGNWYLMPMFWKNLMLDQRPGDALYDLKETYLKGKWDELSSQEALLVGAYTYNYLGDPALRAWLSEPQELQVHPDGETIFTGGDSLTVLVEDLAQTPIYDALVSLYHPVTGEVFSNRTGPDGLVEIEADLTSPGTIRLTVTANGYLPSLQNVTAIESPLDLEVLSADISISPGNPTEGAEMTISAKVVNLKGHAVNGVRVMLFSGRISSDHLEWPAPIAEVTVDLPSSGFAITSLTTSPARSWSSVTVAVEYQADEVNLENNIAFRSVRVNAAPAFYTLPFLEMEEDQDGPATVDLVDFVFDPDNTSGELTFLEMEQHPSWIALDEGGTLTAEPPVNWTGTVSFKVLVSDGLASGEKDVRVIVGPVNDPPALLGVKDIYIATVDRLFSVTLYPIDAEGDLVTIKYTSDLPNLTISSDTLRFVPYPGDEGAHYVNITTSDSHGAFRNYTLEIIVNVSSDLLFFMEPSLHLPDAWEGRRYGYTVSAGGDLAEGAVFTDNTSLFDIDPETGEIEFKPGPDDVGEHWVRIEVTSGNVTISRSFTLDVRQPREVSPGIYWILGGAMALVLLLITLVYLWAGPPVEQYGLEE